MLPLDPNEILVAASEEEMLDLGRRIGVRMRAGDILLLEGDLGAGKTTLAKGIVEGFGASLAEDVSSPTFPIVHEYRGGPAGAHRTVFHLDLYRLETQHEVRGIGLDDLLDAVEDGAAVMLVEWAERFPRLWPADAIRVRITMCDETRKLSLWRPAVE
ncbi:MAG: tRNA (adenosine(37)-N6)-threonylcarbamoyltransferase complex ATPase subunit type 1 TsaE [Bryobacterales bacterium]|nr:tRNA (adenosine(37)-N6)-threonylcarbamoyltransferase complex ATPase subunit type 1 TsaE [Bryobacterales bacterium]